MTDPGKARAQPERTDVLVVGAGPVGLLIATLLARQGIGVIVAECREAPSGSPRAVALDDEGMRAIQAAGLLAALMPRILMGYDHRYFGRGGRLLAEVAPKARPFGFYKRNSFHQPDLEQVLIDGLRAAAPGALRFEARVVALSTTPHGVTASIETVRGAETVEATYVVGCDGGRSTVRSLAGIEMNGTSLPQPWLVVDTERNPDRARYSRALADPARPSVNVPGPGGRRRYEFMMLPGESEEEMVSAERLRALLGPVCDLGRARIVRSAVYVFHALLAERFRSSDGRIFLAGDAAHMMPPFQGQGLNSGIRDAHNLAWKLAAVLKGKIGAGLLATYDQERRPHAAAMIELSRRVGDLLMTRNRARSIVRDITFRILRLLPVTRRYVSEMRFKPAARSSEGFFTANGGAGADWCGRMIPQPMVLFPGGQLRALDDALGDGFALLALCDAPDGRFAAFTDPMWQALQARRIYVTPDRSDFAREDGDLVVSDPGAELRQALGDIGHATLLVRPDRYIAAVTGEHGADEAVKSLFALVSARDDQPMPETPK